MTTPSGDYLNSSQNDGASVPGTFADGQQPVIVGQEPKVPAEEPAKPADQQEPKAEPKADPAPASPPKVDNVPSSTDDAGLVTYDETGDPGLDVALAFIGKLGIAGDHPAMVAAANGDFTYLKAELATRGDDAKGWEQMVALGEAAYSRQAAAYTAEQEKTQKAVEAIVGGADNWKALISWAGENATAEEKRDLNAMFDAGGFQAQAAARAILAAYQQAKGTTINPANPAANASGSAPAAARPLTAQEYYSKVNELYLKHGNNIDNLPEYLELRRQTFGR